MPVPNQEEPSWSWSYVSWIYNYLCNQCLNPAHGEVYLIQHYVIKLVSDLWLVGGFNPGTLVSPPNRIDRHDITEILLKVALNTITQTLTQARKVSNHIYVTVLRMSILFLLVFFISPLPAKAEGDYSFRFCPSH